MSITCSWHDFRAYLFRGDLRLTGLCSVNNGVIIWKKTNSSTDKDIGLLYRVMMSQIAEYLENGAVFANERLKLCRQIGSYAWPIWFYRHRLRLKLSQIHYDGLGKTQGRIESLSKKKLKKPYEQKVRMTFKLRKKITEHFDYFHVSQNFLRQNNQKSRSGDQ